VSDAFANRPTTLADYIAILRRRKWIIIAVPVIAAVVAYFVAKGQSPLYEAQAKILVNRSSVVTAVTNVADPAIGDPARFLTTEANIARSPELARRVIAAVGTPGVTPDELLSHSKVTPEPDADLLDVAVSFPKASEAVRFANAYAEEFARYKTELDTAKIHVALGSLGLRIKKLEANGQTTSPGYSTLVQYQSQLETIGTLLASNTTVLKPADNAAKIRPRPMHGFLLGGVLGGILGLGLAFLAEALDRRVRSEEEIEEALGLPLLGRVRKPPRHLSDLNTLVMRDDFEGDHAEAFRKLRTTIDFANLERGARTIMVTSARPREGKSTTIANLAVAIARSGRRVALVDLDLRRPSLHTFFRERAPHGIADVLANRESIVDTLHPVALESRGSVGSAPPVNGGSPASDPSNGQADVGGSLHLLPFGRTRLATPELFESDQLHPLLETLAERFDVVLVDTPPILVGSEVLAMSPNVDAILLVVHAGIERPVLKELARQLRSCQAAALGFVLTGVSPHDGDAYGYGYGYGYGAPDFDRAKTKKVSLGDRLASASTPGRASRRSRSTGRRPGSQRP
jgi:succinoglycan biosynthesis transport protein ExoP